MSEIDKPDWSALFAALRGDPHDANVWGSLYSGLWPRLNATILARYPLSPEEAEDIVQDAILEYRDTLPAKLQQHGFVPSVAHLFGLVRYRALDRLRETGRVTHLDELFDVADAKDEVVQLDMKLMVDEALDRLDSRCRYVLREFYFQGRTGEEVALRLRTTPENVFVMLNRCRRRCREVLAELHRDIVHKTPFRK